jgi:hypothetical protein
MIQKMKLICGIFILSSSLTMNCTHSEEEEGEEVEATADDASAEAPTEDDATATEETTEEAATESEVTAPPQEESLPPTPAEPSASSGSITEGMGVVRYVKTDGVKIHVRPSASAEAVGTLQKGDHVFVEISGNWAQIGNRGFVETSKLSAEPVARARSKTNWKKN